MQLYSDYTTKNGIIRNRVAPINELAARQKRKK